MVPAYPRSDELLAVVQTLTEDVLSSYFTSDVDVFLYSTKTQTAHILIVHRQMHTSMDINQNNYFISKQPKAYQNVLLQTNDIDL